MTHVTVRRCGARANGGGLVLGGVRLSLDPRTVDGRRAHVTPDRRQPLALEVVRALRRSVGSAVL